MALAIVLAFVFLMCVFIFQIVIHEGKLTRSSSFVLALFLAAVGGAALVLCIVLATHCNKIAQIRTGDRL